MGIQSAYDSWSSTYDSDENFTRDLDHIVLERQLRDFRVDTLLEIGCGTGKNTRFLAEIARRLYALDFSSAMMAIARRKMVSKPVMFCQSDLTTSWPLREHTFDLLVGNLVLEHIEDLGSIFAEAQRVLAAEGVFYISELHPFRQYQGKKAVYRQDGETREITAFVHHISDFLDAAGTHGFRLLELREWWHDIDQGKPPRLVTLLFRAHRTPG